MFQASCHCGGITLTAVQPPATVTSCNCSICYRLGSLWAYFTADQIEIVKVTELREYSWGDKMIRYYSCTQCGCTTHYMSLQKDGRIRVAINTRMAALADTKNIPVRYFDGADSWRYLGEA